MSATQTPRLGLWRWGSGADHPATRSQMNDDTDSLEAKVLIYSEGPDASLPASITNGGQIYYATDTNVFYFDYGTGWDVIGRVVKGTVKNAASVGQTANMEEWRDASNNVVAWIDSAGKFHGHSTDTLSWTSPVNALATGWTNASGYYFGLQFVKSGDNVQVRGEVLAGGAATGLLTILDPLVVPRDTQRFPVWNANSNSYSGQIARLIGSQDAGGGQGGALYIDNFVIGQTYGINLPYIVH